MLVAIGSAAVATYDEIKPGARTDKVLNSVEWENTNDVVLAESTAEESGDTYVKMACLDQLRWCGCDCPCVLKRIRAIGAQGDKSVKDFSEMVVRELTGKSIGL